MDKTTKTLAAFVLAMTLSLAAFSSIASADEIDAEDSEVCTFQDGYKDGRGHRFEDERPEVDDATREALKEAITNNDYDAWLEIVSEAPEGHPLADFVTEDNFALFAEMVQARMDGDYETARQLREELGLKMTHHHAKR